ncbi:MAG: YbaK/EbsC family protein [Planctomycetales bacterium]|nr:YbaK/EbsC family protein [Planctomycetales bacterium]
MNVAKFLQQSDVEFEVIPHRETHDAQHMAQAIHIPGREVAKTVLLRADHGYRYIVAVLPATKQIDLRKASEALNGSELALATEAEIAQCCPDCECGVLPPFGSQYEMTTMVDESLTHEEEVFFEANTHHEAIRMRFADYRRVEEPLVTPLT